MDAEDELLTRWSEVDDRVAKLLREAEDLRARISGRTPPAAADAGHVHEALVLLRADQDRLEAILSQLGRLLDRLRERQEDAEAAHEEALDRATRDTPAGAREYASSQEKAAEARLSTLGSKLTLRRAKRQADQVSSAASYVSKLHRGADGSRSDLRARLDHLRAGGEREYRSVR